MDLFMMMIGFLLGLLVGVAVSGGHQVKMSSEALRGMLRDTLDGMKQDSTVTLHLSVDKCDNGGAGCDDFNPDPPIGTDVQKWRDN